MRPVAARTALVNSRAMRRTRSRALPSLPDHLEHRFTDARPLQEPAAGRAHPARAHPARAQLSYTSPRSRRRMRPGPKRHRARTALLVVVSLLLLAGAAVEIARHESGPALSPLRARIVSIAESQLGYRTDPPDSYCNKFSAYWGSGTATGCPAGLRSEEWCADFAAWVWQKAGAVVVYHFGTGDLNSASYSFYQWGVAHGTWHPVGSNYTPQPGDAAVYGLDVTTQTAVHVAIVTSDPPGEKGPDVVNGDGDRTGFSVVETGTDQFKADVHSPGGLLSGYVSPTSPATPASARSG